MTRLKTEWIEHMPEGMEEYNARLKERTGMDLSDLVMEYYDISRKQMERYRSIHRICVVPVTQGQGIITSFAESVAAIIRSMGFDSEVSSDTDVAGIYGAAKRGRNILFMADDERYIALNTENGMIGENDRATARGFLQLAFSMEEKRRKCIRNAEQRELKGPKILIIGYGRVGKEMVDALLEKVIPFYIYDIDQRKREEFREEFGSGIMLEECPPEKMRTYDIILDLTNTGDWLSADMLGDEVLYLSPGVPLSLKEDALATLQNNAVYDNLEVGTAMMLGQVLTKRRYY